MSETGAGTMVRGSTTFRGNEYVVTMKVVSHQSLVVEVEDRLTADQWRGSFDAAYVEDMTHKTGNFKQFPIFTNMLELAIGQKSDTVSLDLLTFADLELLRQRKAGVGTGAIPGAHQPALNQKRYLILTYTVEFDRIHYPLPLPYMGKPDPTILQDTIRELRGEIRQLKSQGSRDARLRELEKLKQEYGALREEKDGIEEEYLRFRKETKHTSAGTAVKEIRVLKSVVKNLEKDIMKEKTKNQRQSSQRQKEYNIIAEEVEELRATERNLRVRLKSITNELAIYKRRAVTPGGSSSHPSLRDRSTSGDRRFGSSRERPSRPLSREGAPRRQSGWRPMSADRLSRGGYSSDRSASGRGQTQSRERPSSRNRSRDRPPSRTSSVHSYQGRSASPNLASGARCPRFDPTAFIQEKERRLAESAGKKNRRQSGPRPMSGGSAANRVRSTPHLHGSMGSKVSPDPRAVRSLRSETDGLSYGRSRRSDVDRGSLGGGRLRGRTSSVESLGSATSLERRPRHSPLPASDRLMDSASRSNRRSSRQSAAWSAERALRSRNDANQLPSSRKTRRDGESRKYVVNTSTPAAEIARRRTSRLDKENVVQTSLDDGGSFDQSAEIWELDARLERVQKIMQSGL